MIFGALIALASSFSFAVNSILIRRGITGAGATAAQGAFISVLLGVPFGLVAVLATGQLFNFGQVTFDGYFLLAGAGVVHFVIGRYCYYRAIGAIGAPRTVTIQTITVPYSILMAMLLLGERPTLLMYAGIVLILGSPALMIERPKRSTAVPTNPRPNPLPGRGGTGQASTAPAVELRMVEGYVFSLLSSVAYGTSPILIRAAMEGATDAAAVGTFIAYVGAAGVLILSLVLPPQRHLVGTISVRYLQIFGGAGFSVFIAQLLRFFALSLAGVSIVNPLMRTVSVFTLVLSYLVNRRLEHITLGVVLGVLVSFAGSALLVYAAAVA